LEITADGKRYRIDASQDGFMWLFHGPFEGHYFGVDTAIEKIAENTDCVETMRKLYEISAKLGAEGDG
jgi:hypothetical protein